eukprot:3044-Heterococcus_DN1.PRE.1
MEEALPAGVSNAEALAPEEVYTKKRGRDAVFLEGSSEMDQSDRHRARLAKKRVRNQKRRQQTLRLCNQAITIIEVAVAITATIAAGTTAYTAPAATITANTASITATTTATCCTAQGEAEERLVARANPGLGNPYEKKKLLQDIRSATNVTEADETLGGKEFSTSTKFFGALQQSVKDTIKEQAGGAAVVSKKALKKGSAGAALR